MSQVNSVISVPRPGRDPIEIGNDRKLTFIAGPCQLESREHGLEVSQALKEIADRTGVKLVYKTSFDKANRTSLSGKRGLGLSASMDVFNEIRETTGLPLLTDIHTEAQCAPVADAVVRRMSKFLIETDTIGPKEIVDLDGMLVAVSEADGLPNADQLGLLQTFRNVTGVQT